jgi:predicted transcriptional regulator
MLAQPNVYQARIYITDKQLPLLFIVLKFDSTQLQICELRIAQHSTSGTVLRNVLDRLIKEVSKDERRNLIVFLESATTQIERIRVALNECGFFQVANNSWLKLCLQYVGDLNTVVEKVFDLDSINSDQEVAVKNLMDVIVLSAASEDPNQELFARNLLYPIKITSEQTKVFVVPIRTDWAKELFDENLARESLFGVNDRLLLNWENVYYRSSRNAPKEMARGGIILWYASTGTISTQKIIGCSLIEEIVVDDVKPLYQRFKHLGIYSYNHLKNLTHNRSSDKLMAIRFSKTELFAKPIAFAEFKQILNDLENRRNNIQSPVIISTETFEYLYRKGHDMGSEE